MSFIKTAEWDERSLGLPRGRSAALSATLPLAGLAGVKLALQLAGAAHYGFFRDELYYMACGEHLAWGYVDQPPLIAALAWLVRHVFGHSLFSLRLLPAVAGAIVVLLTGHLARELGGGAFAQLLAATGVLLAPAYLAFDSFFSMNAFEPLWWLLCAWIAVRVIRGGSPRLWLAFGFVAGIGMENKHTMLVLGFAVVAGLLLAGEWRQFRSRWMWAGGLVALAIFLPNLLWEAHHGWPQIEVVRNAQLYKNVPISAWRFLGEQIVFLNPVASALWLAGLGWLLFAKEGRPFRFLGWAYLIILVVFLGLGGKSYYPVPAYTILLAAGGVAFERFAGSSSLRWIGKAYPAVLVIAGLCLIPFGVPVLSIGRFTQYARHFPYATLVKTERDAKGVELPQLYADMFGWDNMASTVAAVYHSLPVPDRASCGILAGNYGEAGAIDYYGPALGLPKALSGHNSYFYWGPRGYSGECMIVLGEHSIETIALFEDVRQAATIHSPLAMPNERVVPVYVCRKPRAPLSKLWPRFKMII